MTTMLDPPAHFDTLFTEHADPWGTRSRWYESRKRALTLAVLPQSRYSRAYEPGCGAGELSAELASRCDQLLATDASKAAVARARSRLKSHRNVRVEQALTPREWPPGPFDLVVVSELAYYLDLDEAHDLARAMRASLAPGATVVACHWRHPERDLRLRAHDAHAMLEAGCALAAIARYEDDDFLLEAWSQDPRSVAQREGLA